MSLPLALSVLIHQHKKTFPICLKKVFFHLRKLLERKSIGQSLPDLAPVVTH